MPARDCHGVTMVMVLLLAGTILSMGCTRLEADLEDFILFHTTPMDVCTQETSLPHHGSAMLFAEAERQLSRMTSSTYSHDTSIDEENGTYEYDCSGFVGYALSRADPCAFRVLLHERPNAAQFYYHLVKFTDVPGKGAWMRVATPLELLPGDIIVWLKPDDSDAKSTGHIMVVAGEPERNPLREGEILVRVIDSTTSGHADDTRVSGQTGLGKGMIGIMTDRSGLPTGYFWRGGESKILQETEMAFARIT